MSLTTRLPPRVRVVEVGPRDGLQNEKRPVSADVKIRFIDQLTNSGIRSIEAASFVDPAWVPQMADAEIVLAGIQRAPGARYSALVPNERGLERALRASVDEIAIFGSATETFSHRNLNRSRVESIAMFRPVVRRAREAGLRVRAYVSMAFGDPWEGRVAQSEVVRISLDLLELGADELCIADTIGVATPGAVQDLLATLVGAGIPEDRFAVHFHDTYGQALANVLASLEVGVATFDASAGGLGGCPYAKSATGNLATEDLLWMLSGLGIQTSIDLNTVVKASACISKELGHEPPGRVARALAASCDSTRKV